MREIKFRAWDKKEERFLDNLPIAWQTRNRTFLMFNEDLILMQFTGLKDKKGKEIYEGDIVEKMNVFTDRSIVEFGIESVEDNEGYSANLLSGFYLREIFSHGFYADGRPYSSKGNICKHIDDLDGCEVIGNIYENPDLLKI